MTLSICMITYNHKDYLKQAIDGVLMQKTDFEYELIIANDNSPDNTDEIIQAYIDSDPNGHKIKYLNNEVNLGMMPNFINAFKNCSGKYIALCEGDDYWTDEFKLQKQVDFLEKNKDFSICFHKVKIDNNGVILDDDITKKTKQITTIRNLAKGNYMHTCSVVFRNNLFDKFPEYFANAPVGDYFLHMLNARYGKINCLEGIMANYRVHETSYWSSKKQEERTRIWIEFIEKIKPNFNYQIQNYLQEQIEKTLGIFKKKSFLKRAKLKTFLFFKDFLQN